MSENITLTSRQTSELLGVTQGTLSGWRSRPDAPLKHSTNAAGRIYYSSENVAEYLAESKKHQPLLDAYVAAIYQNIPNI